MPGISSTRKLDDIRIHLQQLISADDARRLPRAADAPAATNAGANADADATALARQSGVLPPRMRATVEALLAEVHEHAPEMGGAETAKYRTSRAAQEALELGMDALARVDCHLQSVTKERKPLLGRNYGVYGPNPRTMASVARALFQCQVENARVKALLIEPSTAEDAQALADRVFTPVIEAAVNDALAALDSLLNGRLSTRAELSRQVSFKLDLIDRAMSNITSVRNHLYANLPQRRRDPDLRDYGFRPLRRRTIEKEMVEKEVVAPASVH